ncbi:MAG: hypothetical protein IT558_05750 [Alphaproteobacteria bacterium]|nr:hypothetical protein [Alphaproteobacteria bacterium]
MKQGNTKRYTGDEVLRLVDTFVAKGNDVSLLWDRRTKITKGITVANLSDAFKAGSVTAWKKHIIDPDLQNDDLSPYSLAEYLIGTGRGKVFESGPRLPKPVAPPPKPLNNPLFRKQAPPPVRSMAPKMERRPKTPENLRRSFERAQKKQWREHEKALDLLDARALSAGKLTLRLIKKSAIETFVKEDWPKRGQLIKYGPLADGRRTWNMIRGAVERKAQGLTVGNCPYKHFEEILAKLKEFTPEEVIASAQATFQRTKKWPNVYKPFKDGPLKYKIKNWKDVNGAMRHKRYGLTEENCPWDTVHEMLVAKGLKKEIFSDTPISVSKIVWSAFLAWEKSKTPENPEGKWPVATDGLIKYGPLADGLTTWEAVERAIVGKYRGLTDENCPYDKSLHEVFVGEGLIVLPVALTMERIKASAIATWEHSKTNGHPQGRWPAAQDGLIVHGPLADGHNTWGQVNESIERKGRGLTENVCPYSSLSTLLVGEGLKSPRSNQIQHMPPPQLAA